MIQVFHVYRGGTTGPLVVLFHGAGHTSMSWALVSRLLKRECRVFAFDCRGHGKTVCKIDTDFSSDTLVSDAVKLINHEWNNIPVHTIHVSDFMSGNRRIPLPFSEAEKSGKPDVLLVGHSMGGAIASRVAASGSIPQLQGLLVMDVTEGVAMANLKNMDAWIARLPTFFVSIESAVHWALENRILSNKESAALSIPSQLEKQDGKWVWRTSLHQTRPYWEGWFEGLSTVFLSAKCVKALVLSGVEVLDTPLTMAHMQGKFQLTPLRVQGHIIQEDQPEICAQQILDFVHRYRLFG